MQAETLAAACLGKMPTYGDFVRHRASTPSMRALDAWMQQGLYRAKQRDGRAIDSAYDAAPIYHFLFNEPEAPSTLLGVLKPSRDRSGRKYPFMVTVEVAPQAYTARTVAYLPLQAEAFYRQAHRLVEEATEGTVERGDIAGRVEQLDTGLALTTEPPPTYKRYLQQHTLAGLLARLFDHFSDGRKYRLFDNLLKALLPLRGQRNPRLSYALRFPLTSDEASAAHEACFWLEACWRLLDHPGVAPTLLWTVPPAEASFALLFVGPPRAGVFTHLMTPDTAQDSVFELERVGEQNAAQAALSIPVQYGELLEDEQITLWDFLRRL